MQRVDAAGQPSGPSARYGEDHPASAGSQVDAPGSALVGLPGASQDIGRERARTSEIEWSLEETEEELRRRRHYEEIREQLHRERTRILDRLLPARFALAGAAQVFPVAVEIRLPERGGQDLYAWLHLHYPGNEEDNPQVRGW